MFSAALITSLVQAALGLIVGALGMHVYHTSPSGAPATDPPLPVPAPTDPLPNHPILSRVLHEILQDGEQAAIAAIRTRLGGSAPPTAGVTTAPSIAPAPASVK